MTAIARHDLDAGQPIVSKDTQGRYWVGISTGDQDQTFTEDWTVTIAHVIVFDDFGKVLATHPYAGVSVEGVDRAKDDRYSALGDYAGAMGDSAFHARQKAEDAAREATELDAATNAAIEAMNL